MYVHGAGEVRSYPVDTGTISSLAQSKPGEPERGIDAEWRRPDVR